MNLRELLSEIAARGLRITAQDGDLRLEGPRDRIDADLVAQIRAVKPELLARLSAPAIPLTPLQRGYFVGRGSVAEMGNVASQVFHEIEGCWDLDRLEAALREVVSRHDALRVAFDADGGAYVEPYNDVEADVRIGLDDLRALPRAEQDARLETLRTERSHHVLPADRAPLIAASAVVLADDRMVLHVAHDGLAMDGISMFLFFRDWWRAYQGDPAGDDEPMPLAQYAAAMEQARGGKPAERSRRSWQARIEDLAGYPDLPLRTSPGSITHPRFTQRTVRLDPAHWTRLRQRAAAEGLTPSAALLAAYSEVLATWGGGPRFTLAATIANRPPIHPRINESVGQFSDTLLLDVAVDRAEPFAERARRAQTELRRSLDDRHWSGIEVLAELARRGRDARMPYTFNSAIGHAVEGVDGSALELFGRESFTVSQTPQVWLNVFAMEQHGGLVVQLDGVDELFPEGLPDALAHGYRHLLELLCEPDAWRARTFDLLPPEQRERRREANRTTTELPEEAGLLDAFLARAAEDPERPALITSHTTVSYGQLRDRAAAAAGWLREHGIGRDELVGLVMTRGPEQILGILATVLAGGAYLPVDATLPPERRGYMLRDGRVRCVLTNAAEQDPAGSTAVAAAGRPSTPLHVLTLDLATPAPPAGTPAVPDPLPGTGLDDLAYVLYTSGTTGEPKGVMISRRSVLNLVADCDARFAITPADRFFAISAFNFDLSVWDVFGALSAGAALVLPDAPSAADPAHWLERCQAAGTTVWNSVPAIVGLLQEQAHADDAAHCLSTLRLTMMSGDRIPPTLPTALWELKPDLEVVSLGGPTETTVWNILHHPVIPADAEGASIPYGRPNNNNRAYILDADGLDAPDWVTGEICAAGTGLARGYWDDQTRTDAKFHQDPGRAERLYRTGDLGRYLPNGDIAILGRTDFQIKVNGYRIEAGEVESRLVDNAAVKQAAVVRQEGARGDRLVAHLVAAGDERPADTALREQLRRHLPDYMLPSAFAWHESLPLTRNGKVDRGRLTAADAPGLPEAPEDETDPATDQAPASPTETAVADLWENILKRAPIGRDRRFYDLGGDSLAAARVLTAVRKQFGVVMPLDQMHEVATVRAMAARIDAAHTEGA